MTVIAGEVAEFADVELECLEGEATQFVIELRFKVRSFEDGEFEGGHAEIGRGR